MEFDLNKIRENENMLREKYGRSARDIDRDSEHADERLIEVCDVSAMMKELLETKKTYLNKKQEVHRLVMAMAGDAFIYYPKKYADNWIQNANILNFEEYIEIETEHQVEDDKIKDFCDRTGLELIKTKVYGSLPNPSATYIFDFERDDEWDPCQGCCSMIECEDCCYSNSY